MIMKKKIIIKTIIIIIKLKKASFSNEHIKNSLTRNGCRRNEHQQKQQEQQ
jgi:hypothetical protein